MFKPQSLIHGGFEVHFDAFHPTICFILSNLSLPKTIPWIEFLLRGCSSFKITISTLCEWVLILTTELLSLF